MKTEKPPRIIMIVVKGGNHFDVHEGEGYADHLTWDEMLGCVAELTHPAHKCARYFQSPEERDAQDAFRSERMRAREARNARIEAERAALPTITLRALHSFVELHGDRDYHADDELLPLDQQPNPDVQAAMRTLAAALQPTTT